MEASGRMEDVRISFPLPIGFSRVVPFRAQVNGSDTHPRIGIWGMLHMCLPGTLECSMSMDRCHIMTFVCATLFLLQQELLLLFLLEPKHNWPVQTWSRLVPSASQCVSGKHLVPSLGPAGKRAGNCRACLRCTEMNPQHCNNQLINYHLSREAGFERNKLFYQRERLEGDQAAF